MISLQDVIRIASDMSLFEDDDELREIALKWYKAAKHQVIRESIDIDALLAMIDMVYCSIGHDSKDHDCPWLLIKQRICNDC